MWTLEVYKKRTGGDYGTISKEVFEGFDTRREAEVKIESYYESEMSNPDITYSFFLISPYGNVFPVDIFGTAYLNMISGYYKDIL